MTGRGGGLVERIYAATMTSRMDGVEPSAVIVSPWDLEAFDRAHGDGEALRTLWSLPILVSRDIPIGTARVVRYDLELDVKASS